VGVGKISSSLPVNLTEIPKIIIQKFSPKISDPGTADRDRSGGSATSFYSPVLGRYEVFA
jgi:hypothetical protein